MRRALLASMLLLTGCGDVVLVLSPGDAGSLPPPPEPGMDVSAGTAHACEIIGGALACHGSNADLMIGQSDRGSRSAPVRVGSTLDWTSVSVGYDFSCGVREGGRLECFGGNDAGQLAQGDSLPRFTPERVALRAPVVLVEAGFQHACAVLGDASLWCWGQNDEAQTGVGFGPRVVSLPTEIAPGLAVSRVSAGDGHTCTITAVGALLCWGRNGANELGLGPGMPGNVPTPTEVGGMWREVAAGQTTTLGIDQSGGLWAWGADFENDGYPGPGGLPGHPRPDRPTRVGEGRDWQQVSVDTFHACGVRGAGELWCWGRNAEGQLGMGDIDTRYDEPTRVGADADWARVAVGRFFTCAQKIDGSVWCTGAAENGQLGVGDTERRNVLTPLSGLE